MLRNTNREVFKNLLITSTTVKLKDRCSTKFQSFAEFELNYAGISLLPAKWQNIYFGSRLLRRFPAIGLLSSPAVYSIKDVSRNFKEVVSL